MSKNTIYVEEKYCLLRNVLNNARFKKVKKLILLQMKNYSNLMHVRSIDLYHNVRFFDTSDTFNTPLTPQLFRQAVNAQKTQITASLYEVLEQLIVWLCD